MGVSLESYRIIIGCYQPRQLVIGQNRVKSIKQNPVLTLRYILTLILISCIPLNLMYLSIDISMKTSQWQSGLMGFHASATNKVCHSLNGNRR